VLVAVVATKEEEAKPAEEAAPAKK
jgi:hypothetical protein